MSWTARLRPCRPEGQRGQEPPYDGIKLGEDNSVYATFALRSSGAGKVFQGSVEFGQLIDGLIADQGFADKYNLVRVVDGDEQWISSVGRRPTLARALINGSLSCIRPAVSINTTSKRYSLAAVSAKRGRTCHKRSRPSRCPPHPCHSLSHIALQRQTPHSRRRDYGRAPEAVPRPRF